MTDYESLEIEEVTSEDLRETQQQEAAEEPFDFAEHRRIAVEEYLRVRPQYEAFCQAVREILAQALRSSSITVNSVEARAKEPESFGAKAGTPGEDDPGAPKYWRPLEEITDLAGVRIITFFRELWHPLVIASGMSSRLLSTLT